MELVNGKLYGSTDKPAEKIFPVLIAQQEALESLFSFVAQKRELSLFYIRQLYQIFTQHQETVDAVTYRKRFFSAATFNRN